MRRVGAAILVLVLVSDTAPATQVRTGREASAEREEPEMVLVPGGEFTMGLTEGDELEQLIESCEEEVGEDALADEFCTEHNPQFRDAMTGMKGRRVFLYDFRIDRREVTTAEYRECVAAGSCDLTPLVTGDVRFIQDEWPIVSVTYDDAQRYCEWRGKRLPTEAEWEKAARGTDARRWPWGNVDSIDRANRGAVEPTELRPYTRMGTGTTTDESDGSKILVPPGSHPFGKSPYGADDMAGNVAEWVADWYSETSYQPINVKAMDPAGPHTGTYRVVRGGGFDDPRMFARTYIRRRALPTQRSISRGFRCALGQWNTIAR
jgi:formylglycine-generating enzyme required for sulfatase activity